jgi:hypothetical protein
MLFLQVPWLAKELKGHAEEVEDFQLCLEAGKVKR